MTKINVNSTKFLKVEELKHKDIVFFETEGGWEESAMFKKDDGTPAKTYKINIKLVNGETRQITLSWTNLKLLVRAFGDETSTWVGKEVRAWQTKSERAKAGFVYLYVPTNWVRNDMGEWEVNGKSINDEEVHIEYPEDEPSIDPETGRDLSEQVF